MTEFDGARLTVDLDALALNYAAVSRNACGAEVAPVVKADAYGLGLTAISERLRRCGAASFFVARLTEGEALRTALGGGVEIYVLDGCGRNDADRLVRSRLTPVLNGPEQVADYARAVHCAKTPVALHVDTGLNRLGFTLEEAVALARDGPPEILRVALVISHLAWGSEPSHAANPLQLARFREVCARFPEARYSLAASAGIFLGREYVFDLVRPGVALYGGGPFGRPDLRFGAVATFDAPILQVRTLAAGEAVGYGAAFVALRPTRVAIVAAGYADGVLRASSPRGYGTCDGRRLPLIGRVSMDLVAMDATETPSAERGARVQLVGDAVPVDDAAAAAGTIAYEVLVRLGRGSDRRHIGACA